MKTIVKLIEDVDPAVKDYVLRALLERNQLMSMISYYKRRIVEKAGVCNEVECGVIIFKLLKFCVDQNVNSKKTPLSKKTAELARIPDHVLKDFNLFNTSK